MTSDKQHRVDDLLTDAERRLQVATGRIGRLCKSSLEVRLGEALVTCQIEFGPARVIANAQGAPMGHGFYIVPQFRMLSYSADFALFLRSGLLSARLLVEADGAYWHDRDEVQRSRDSSRDTALMRAGWPVLRFSEAKIKDDPAACADAAWGRLYAAWSLHSHNQSEYREHQA